MKKKLLGGSIALGGMLTAAVAFTAPALAQGTVKIGLIMTYSGPFADPAASMDNAVKLYVKKHGDTVAGKKLEFIRRDSTGSPDTARRLAQELVVREKVDILAGFVLTPEALGAADVSAEAKKLMVVMNAATSVVTTRSPYIVRTSVTIPQLQEAFGTWARKNGVQKVFTLVSDYGPGHDAEQAFQLGFKNAGGEIVGSVRTPLANPDFAPFVQRAKDANPGGIFVFIPGGPQTPALGKAIVERGIDLKKVRVMGQGELTDDPALKAMGDAAIGMVTVFHYDHNHNSAKNREFVKEFNKESGGRNPDLFAIGGYDGMHLIYEALKKTKGNTDGEELVGASRGMAWESPRGPMSIDPRTRDVIQTVYIRRVEKVGGQLKNVEFDKIEKVKDPFKERN
jgi:branched-chain amino acid transport system substrate-binding protein